MVVSSMLKYVDVSEKRFRCLCRPRAFNATWLEKWALAVLAFRRRRVSVERVQVVSLHEDLANASPEMLTEAEFEQVWLASHKDEKREDGGIIHHSIRYGRGEFIGAGVSGVVELLPNGNVIKSPWTGWEAKDSREDILREIRAYQRLFNHFSVHDRFLTPISCDESECTITMENMVNGTLRDYLEAPGRRISQGQQHEWILALAEGMQLLHVANIVHCDFSPRNMLLDQALCLKVADFGCCSMDASLSSGCGSARFYPPHTPYRSPVTVEYDLFALGSSIYEVLIGMPPYNDLATKQVQDLYALQQFPDLTAVEFADIIRDCWLFQAGSARRVYERVLAILGT